MIDQIVSKAVPMAQTVRYEMNANGWLREHTLRFVVNPETFLKMKAEALAYWPPAVRWEVGEDGMAMSVTAPIDRPSTDHIWGIKVMTDEAVPAGEVELRAIYARSWE